MIILGFGKGKEFEKKIKLKCKRIRLLVWVKNTENVAEMTVLNVNEMINQIYKRQF